MLDRRMLTAAQAVPFVVGRYKANLFATTAAAVGCVLVMSLAIRHRHSNLYDKAKVFYVPMQSQRNRVVRDQALRLLIGVG